MTCAQLNDRTAVLDANPSLQSYCNNPSRAYKSFRIFGDVRHSAFPFGCGGAKKQQGESLQQTSSAASNGNWFICGATTPAALLRQISSPIQLK